MKNNTSYVYFVQNLFTGNIKIGRSMYPETRFKELQTGNDCKLSLMAFCEEYYHKESKLHKQFSNYRLNGEWFKYNENLINLINNIRSANLLKYGKEVGNVS